MPPNPLPSSIPLLPASDIDPTQTTQAPDDQTPTQSVVPTNATFAPGITFNGQLMSPSAYGMGGSSTSTTSTPTPTAKTPPAASGIANNPIVRNLQNVGDIAGGILGAPLGAGDIGTAAVGRGIGEFLKEGIDDLFGGKINGKKVGISAKNIAEETGLGALSQATGDLGGKVFGKVADAAGSQGLKLTAQSVFPNVANKDLVKNGAMSTIKDLMGYGIKASDLPDAVAQTAGADGIFNAANNRAFNLVKGKLSTTGLQDQLSTVYKYLDYASPGRGKAVMKILSPYGVKVGEDGAITVPKTLNAADAHEIQHNLEGLAYDFTNPQPVKNAIYSAARSFESAIDNTASATKSLGKYYTDDELAALREISPKLADEASSVNTIRAGRSISAPFTRASKLLQASAEAAENPNIKEVGGSVLNKVAAAGELLKGYGGVPGRLAGAGDLLYNSTAGKRLLGKGAMALSSGADKLANKPMLSQILKTTLPQSASGIMPSNQSSGPVSSALSSQITQAQTALTQATNTNGTNSSTGALSPSDFSNLMSEYGSNGMSKYMDYLQMTAPELSSNQQTGITLAQNSLSQIQQMSNLYDKAMSSGTTGKLLSGVSKLPVVGGALGDVITSLGKNTTAASDYSAYMARRYDLARTVSKLASEGGQTGGLSSIEAIEKLLPTLSDSPLEAQTKFQSAIQSIITSSQAILGAPATNTPGQLTSFAGSNIPGSGLPAISTGLANPLNIGVGGL